MQADLFDARVIPGLRLVEEAIDAAAERAMIASIDAAALAPFRFGPWEGKRLTRSFGPSYDFERGRMAEGEPIPSWLHPSREVAAGVAGVAADAFVQALVIRYDPGAGIGWHKDRPMFGTVVGISLGAAADMRFRRRREGGFDRRTVPLAPRSLYVLDGAVRDEWEHSISPMAEPRWSITFRTLRA